MAWGCSPITALLASMRSAPPIMDQKGQTRQMQKEIAGAAQSSGRMRRAARLRPPMDKEDERASLRRDADDVVIRFAGILEIAGAQLKPASF